MKALLKFLGILWLVLFSLFCVAASAQSTTVSTTGVVDTPDGSTWAGGTYAINFIPSGGLSPSAYNWNGGTMVGHTQFTGALNSSGAFSVAIPSSALITPTGSQWNIQVCPNATTGCVALSTAVSGTTMNLTSTINAIAVSPRFQVTGNNSGYGYNTAEVLATIKPGTFFYNTTPSASPTCNQWSGSAWVSCGAGSGSGTVGTGTAGQYARYLTNGTTVSGESPFFILVTDPPYNAKCDGSTDDTTALQAAFNSGAPEIDLPNQAVCFFSSTLTLPYSTILNGNQGTLQYTGASGGTLIDNSANGVAIVKNINITPNYAVTATQTLLALGSDSEVDLLVLFVPATRNVDIVAVSMTGDGTFSITNSFLNGGRITSSTGAATIVIQNTFIDLTRSTHASNPVTLTGDGASLASVLVSNSSIKTNNSSNAAACMICIATGPSYVSMTSINFTSGGSYTGHLITNSDGVNTATIQGDSRFSTSGSIFSGNWNGQINVSGSTYLGNGANANILAPAATTTNTLTFPAVANANLDLWYCALSGTTCQMTDTGYHYNSIPAADIAAGALANGMTATTQSQLDGSTKLATTAYTDLAVSNAVAGVNPAVAVLAASTANVVGTYTQVGGGVGDTFTVTATGAFTLDGIAINTIGQRVLFKDQSTASQNGVYTATVPGSLGVSPVFTRALDYDTPSDVNNTGTIPVQSGTANTTTSWLLTSQVTSIGSAGSSLTYAKFSLAPSSIVTAASPGVGLCHFAGGTQACTSSAVVGGDMANNTVTATQLATQYSKGSCTEAWGGSGTSFALTSGDDAISNNTCYNDSGVTRTITAVKCRNDNSSNTTTVNPTFGSAGTGTTILSGALTCGNSYAYSSSGTVSNASWTTGTGISPGMSGTLTGTSVAMIVEYTY